MLFENTTTIEGWEISRHRTLVRRSRVLGGFLDGPDGTKIRIKKQEFPYDIGIWKNLRDGMGSANPLQWFWPFAATPHHGAGLEFEVNGFEDAHTSWPPPDPDRIHRRFEPLQSTATSPFAVREQSAANFDVEAFRRRQQADLQRQAGFHRRRPFHERHADLADNTERGYENDSIDGDEDSDEGKGTSGGEEGWRDAEGDRLGDFGVDEEAEFYDEDDIPLAQLIEQRRNQTRQATNT
ncbi:Palmitoyltransferase [Arachnomyces sp. PD_36]|nr:Palmitoyltransferase [Arachnomyces sp. PD_36]